MIYERKSSYCTVNEYSYNYYYYNRTATAVQL